MIQFIDGCLKDEATYKESAVLPTQRDVSFRSIQTLISPGWLNDEVVNRYGDLIIELLQSQSVRFPSSHVFAKVENVGFDVAAASFSPLRAVVSTDCLAVPSLCTFHPLASSRGIPPHQL